jgi:hypothetical protein
VLWENFAQHVHTLVDSVKLTSTIDDTFSVRIQIFKKINIFDLDIQSTLASEVPTVRALDRP